MKFAPIFQRMHDVIASIEASEKKRLVAQKRIDKADVAIQLLDNDADEDNLFDFLSEWADEDSTKLMLEVKKALKSKPEDRGHPDRLDWDAIASAFPAHEAVECRSEFDRLSALSTIKSGTTILNGIDTWLKSLMRQKANIRFFLKIRYPH